MPKRINKKRQTRISKPLAWIGKYLERVGRRMPTMATPRLVRSFKPHPKKEHRTLGNCCVEDKTITLATHSIVEKIINGRKSRKLEPLSHLEILQTLAHEIAHLAYEAHGYEHEWYARTIFNTFGLKESCPHCQGRGKIPARYKND